MVSSPVRKARPWTLFYKMPIKRPGAPLSPPPVKRKIESTTTGGILNRFAETIDSCRQGSCILLQTSITERARETGVEDREEESDHWWLRRIWSLWIHHQAFSAAENRRLWSWWHPHCTKRRVQMDQICIWLEVVAQYNPNKIERPSCSRVAPHNPQQPGHGQLEGQS